MACRTELHAFGVFGVIGAYLFGVQHHAGIGIRPSVAHKADHLKSGGPLTGSAPSTDGTDPVWHQAQTAFI